MKCSTCKGKGTVSTGDTCPGCIDEGLSPSTLKPVVHVRIAESAEKLALLRIPESTFDRLSAVAIARNMSVVDLIESLSKEAFLLMMEDAATDEFWKNLGKDS